MVNPNRCCQICGIRDLLFLRRLRGRRSSLLELMPVRMPIIPVVYFEVRPLALGLKKVET